MQTSDKKNEQPPVQPGSLDELEELLAEFQTAMLTTVTPEGLLRARPMAVQEPHDELPCDLWFVTGIDTPKVNEIEHEHQVGVSCLRQKDGAYLSVSGLARVRQDPELVRRLWKPDWKIWFPEGPDDPKIAILEMRVERAEYWEPKGGRLRVVYEIAKSLVKGEPAGANLPPRKKI